MYRCPYCGKAIEPACPECGKVLPKSLEIVITEEEAEEICRDAEMTEAERRFWDWLFGDGEMPEGWNDGAV